MQPAVTSGAMDSNKDTVGSMGVRIQEYKDHEKNK